MLNLAQFTIFFLYFANFTIKIIILLLGIRVAYIKRIIFSHQKYEKII